MKRITFSLLAVLFSIVSWSQTPIWDMAVSAGGDNGDDWISSIAKNGDQTLVGGFLGSSTGQLFAQPYAFGTSKSFVAVLGKTGETIRSHYFEDNVSSFTRDMKVAWLPDGGYLAAFLFDQDTIEVDGNLIINKGSSDVAVVRYDQDGNLEWWTSFGGEAYESLGGLVTMGDRIILAVSFASDSITMGNVTYTNPKGTDNVLVEFNSSGDVVQSSQLGEFVGGANQYANKQISKMVLGQNGKVYVALSATAQSVLLGGSLAPDNILIVEVDSDLEFVSYLAVPEIFSVPNFEIDSDGDVLIGGQTGWGITIGEPMYGCFFQKMSMSGDTLWRKVYDNGFGQPGRIDASTIEFGKDGKLYGVLSFAHKVTVEGIDYLTTPVPYDEGWQNGVSHYTKLALMEINPATGDANWVQVIGGSYQDGFNDMAVETNGDVYLGISYQSNPFEAGDLSLVNNGQEGGYYFHFEYHHWRKSRMGLLRYRQDVNTGVDHDAHNQVKVFPNPVEDVLSLDVPNSDEYVVELFNLEGVLVKRMSGARTLDLSDLDAGVYFLKATSNTSILSSRVVKQ